MRVMLLSLLNRLGTELRLIFVKEKSLLFDKDTYVAVPSASALYGYLSCSLLLTSHKLKRNES